MNAGGTPSYAVCSMARSRYTHSAAPQKDRIFVWISRDTAKKNGSMSKISIRYKCHSPWKSFDLDRSAYSCNRSNSQDLRIGDLYHREQ